MRRILGAIAVGLLASAAAAGDWDAADAAAAKGDAAALAEALLRLGRPEDAGRELERALEKAPGDAALTLLRGRAAMDAAEALARGKDGAKAAAVPLGIARRCFEPMLAKDPAAIGALVLKGRWTHLQPDRTPQEAGAILEAAAAAAPGDFEAVYRLARFHFLAAGKDNKKKELWQKADDALKAAQKIDPASGAAAWHRALCRQWLGLPKRDLLLDYEKAATLATDNPAPLVKLVDLTDVGSRARLLERLIAGNPGNATLLWQKFLHEGKADPEPADPRTAVAAARLLDHQGDDVGAAAAYAKALDLCAGTLRREVYDAAADFAALSVEPLAETRETAWTSLWKAFPKEPKGPLEAAAWQRDVGKAPEKAAAWLGRALEAWPGDVDARAALGDLEPAKAEEHYRKAIALAEAAKLNHPERSPGWRRAVDGYVRILVAAGRVKELREFAEGHLKDDPRLDSVMLLVKLREADAPPKKK